LLSLAILVIQFFTHRSSAELLYDILDSQIQHGTPINRSSTTHLDPYHLNTYLTTDIHFQANPYISSLTRCSHAPNLFTSHIRLSAQHLNISLTPPGSEPTPGRHFNPAFLRLPSWATKSPVAQGAKYVLVTRAVTEGLHQESLICLADVCLPQQEVEKEETEELKNKRRTPLPPDTRACNPSDHQILGPYGGMRCVTPPIKLNIPPTPALRCTGEWANFPHIAGFHDPRIYWSNRGEPLIILNSASQYGCVGLWLLDLRTVYPDLGQVLSRDGKKKAWESATISYSHLTELTRMDRSQVEKNWMLFFPGLEGEAIIQYDALPSYHFAVNHSQIRAGMNQSLVHTKRTLPISSSNGGRTLARLIGAGHATPNITSQHEQTCFPPDSIFDNIGQKGHWHQSTNALKLILCTRQQYRNGKCGKFTEWTESGREVHFSIMHRKFSNELDLPMRYERYVVVWEGRELFRMVGVSKWPMLFEDERARPWSVGENWPEDQAAKKLMRNDTVVEHGVNESDGKASNWTVPQHMLEGGKAELWKREQPGHHNITRRERSSAYFTYTPSISWVWRPTPDHFEEGEGDVEEMERLGMGFLGDDLLVGIGLDDVEQVFVRMKVDEIVGYLRLCEGFEAK